VYPCARMAHKVPLDLGRGPGQRCHALLDAIEAHATRGACRHHLQARDSGTVGCATEDSASLFNHTSGRGRLPPGQLGGDRQEALRADQRRLTRVSALCGRVNSVSSNRRSRHEVKEASSRHAAGEGRRQQGCSKVWKQV
jgi:hypothetical protein